MKHARGKINQARNARIVRLSATMSYGMIALELKVSRNVVAGVLFRDRYPVEARFASPGSGGSPNTIGSGVRGGWSKHAKRTLPTGRTAWGSA